MALNALFVGASGLTTFSTALDIVGNNLANINTTGYKTQRTQFRDVVYQTLNSGTSSTTTSGGTNPLQLGFGTTIGSIDTLFTQANLTPTGRALDVAIQGDGFFVADTGLTKQYTRAGSFDVDSSGFLVDPSSGYRIQRFGSVGEGTATLPGFQVAGNNNIQIPFGTGVSGLPSANVRYQGNLDSGLTIGQSVVTAIQVFDSQSTSRALTVTFTKTAANTFGVTAAISGGTATIPPGTSVTFDNAGLLVSPASVPVSITGIAGAAAQSINLNLGTPGQATGITQFGGTSTATAVNQDGSGSGSLTTVSVDQSGVIQGQFSNGRTIPIAQLAVASFDNQGGLSRAGGNYFQTSAASGEALLGVGGVGSRGLVRGASLEGSNVDIAIEFSKLIVAQRGFQVNARTVTAANETLQELATIIR